MKRNSIGRIFSLVLSLAMILGTMLCGTVTAGAVEKLVETITYTDDFSEYTTATAPLNTTDYPDPLNANFSAMKGGHVIAEGSKFKYTYSPHYGEGGEFRANVFTYNVVDLDNDTLMMQGDYTRAAVNANVSLVGGSFDKLTNATVSYKTSETATGAGVDLFTSADEKTHYRFYHAPVFDKSTGHQQTPGYNTYLENCTNGNNYAYVAQVKDGTVSVIALQQITTDAGENISGGSRNYKWDINVNNGVVSWTFTTYEGEATAINEWKGSFTEGEQITTLNQNGSSTVTLESLSTSEYAFPLSLSGNSKRYNSGSSSYTDSVLEPTTVTSISLSGTASVEADPIFADDFTGYTAETAPYNDTNYTSDNQDSKSSMPKGTVVGTHSTGLKWVSGENPNSWGDAAAFIDITNGEGLHANGGQKGTDHLPINLDTGNGKFGALKKFYVESTVKTCENGVRFCIDENEQNYFELVYSGPETRTGYSYPCIHSKAEGREVGSREMAPALFKTVNGVTSLVASAPLSGGTWIAKTSSSQFALYKYGFEVEVTGDNTFSYKISEITLSDGGLHGYWEGTYTDTDNILNANCKYPLALMATGHSTESAGYFKNVKLWTDHYSLINSDGMPVVRIMPYGYAGLNGDINMVAATYDENAVDHTEIKRISKADAPSGVAEVTFGAVDTSKVNKLFMFNGDIKGDIVPLDECIEYK